MCGKMSVFHTEKGVNGNQGSSRHPTRHRTDPTTKTNLPQKVNSAETEKKTQLKNSCIINSYTFLQPASPNLEHFTFVRSISELLCYLFKSPNPNQCDSSLTLCVCVCVCVKEVFIVFQTILDFGQRLIHLITIWTCLYYFMPTCYMPIILPLSTFQMISFLITVSQLTFEQ